MAIDKRTTKDESLDSLTSRIRSAFYNEFSRPIERSYEDVWVKEIFDDKVIVESEDGLFSYPYTINADDEVEFGEPVKVEVQYTPAKTIVKPIKTEDDEWLLDVLGVPFDGPHDGKDDDGEYFSAETDFMLSELPQRPVIHYHGANYDKPEIIGKELSHEVKNDGVWFRVALDKANETAGRLWQSAKDGLARASSGSMQHLIRKDEDGHISVWPLSELSLLDMSNGEYPANPYAIAAPLAKANFKAAKLDWPFDDGNTADPEPAEPGVGAETPQASAANTKQQQETHEEDKMGFTLEELDALLDKREQRKAEAEAAKAEKARIEELETKAKELDELKTEIKEANDKREEPGRKQVKRLPNVDSGDDTPDPDQPITGYSKWDGFTIGQLGMAWEMLGAVKAGRPMSLYRALHTKAMKDVKSGKIYENHIERDKNGLIKRELNSALTAKAVKAMTGINPMSLADKAIKADELHGSDVVDGGDEWVPILWSTELWDLVRNEARVLSRFRQVDVMGESLSVPTLEGKTTVYKVAQTDDESELAFSSAPAVSSKVTTGKTTLTPVKNMAWLIWTGELDEDSIVPILPTLQDALRMDVMEQIDEMLISGDTDTANTNISDRGNGSIATTWHLLSVNGLRDYALGNSNASDIGALTAEDFLTVMQLLGTAGAYALDPERLFWVCDPAFYRKALALGEALTRDKNSAATIESGRLVRMYGSDFFTSDKYAKTDSNGEIHNTGGNNTKGSVLLVRPDRWLVGFGRRIRIESPARGAAEIVADANHLIASFRIDFQTHSGGEGSALGYNVTV